MQTKGKHKRVCAIGLVIFVSVLGQAPHSAAMKADLHIALALPFSGGDRAITQMALDLWDSARLAVKQRQTTNVRLIALDTRANKAGGRDAIQQAKAEGADIILGPLLSSSMKDLPFLRAAHPPILAFGNNPDWANGAPTPNIWLWGHTPDNGIRRLLDYTAAQYRPNIAALLPRNAAGDTLAKLLPKVAARSRITLLQTERYTRAASAMLAPVRRIAAYAARQQALVNERQRRVTAGDIRGLAELAQRETWGEVAYDAILLAETGDALKNLAALLPFYEVDMREVQILLPYFWYAPQLAREQPLRGAWFASAPQEGWIRFRDSFQASYQRAPQRLASLAYDGVSFILDLHQRAGGKRRSAFSTKNLLAYQDFIGVDGRARLTAQGQNERLLAVFALTPRGRQQIAGAPPRFAR